MTKAEETELWAKVNQNKEDIAVLRETQNIENKHMADAIETLGQGLKGLSKAVYLMMGGVAVVNILIVPFVQYLLGGR